MARKKRAERKTGQISIEYLIIMGFVTMSLIPLAIVYFTYSSETKDQIIDSQVNQIAKKIVDNAEAVYYLGDMSRTTLKMYMPENVMNVTVQDNEIVFKVKGLHGVSDVAEYSFVNMTGSIDAGSGIKYITIESKGEYVRIASE